ncbi:MAG: SusC/RagA family TonB-linked outer membrane protein, partial [Bacteroidota bacterium]
GGVNLTLKPYEGFIFKSTYDIDLSYGNNNYWTPEYYYHSINYNYLSSVNQSTQRWFTWQWENVLTYSKQIGAHDLTVMAGNTLREFQYYYFGGLGEGLQEESWDFAVFDAVLSDSTKSAVSGTRAGGNRLLSYFGRIQYNYDSRYMLNFALRSDASSKLSAKNRTQYFPSLSLGWVLTNEEFWNFTPVSFLKLRLSWGQNGSIQSLGNFEYVSTISSTAESSYYISGGTRLAGAEPTALSNPDLIWETSEQTNVGIDARFFNDRLAFSVDYYKKKTIGLITFAAIPEYVGNNKPNANSGDITNQGIELELSFKGNIADINYSIGANAAYNKNEVTNLASPLLGANLGTSGALTRAEEGYPVWYFYGFQDDGIFDSFDEINSYINVDGDPIQPNAIPGDVRFVDIDGDGKINEDDKTMIGSPHPDWIFGLNTNLNYKGFDLTIFLQGALGNEVYYGAYRTDLNNNNKPYFLYENAWTPENQSGEFPRYTVNDNNNNFSHNSMFVFDGSYLRVQNLELGYSLKNSMLNKLSIEKLRIYVSGRNLFVLTSYPGADPEVGNSNFGDDKTSIGIDRGLYPRSKIISFGINMSI